jgi:hypothetical protein
MHTGMVSQVTGAVLPMGPAVLPVLHPNYEGHPSDLLRMGVTQVCSVYSNMVLLYWLCRLCSIATTPALLEISM